LTLQLVLDDHEPLFDDIPGGFLLFQKGLFSNMSFATDGINYDARVGPHVTGSITSPEEVLYFMTGQPKMGP